MAVFMPMPPPVAPIAAVTSGTSQRQERTPQQVRTETARAVDPTDKATRPNPGQRRGNIVDIAV